MEDILAGLREELDAVDLSAGEWFTTPSRANESHLGVLNDTGQRLLALLTLAHKQYSGLLRELAALEADTSGDAWDAKYAWISKHRTLRTRIGLLTTLLKSSVYGQFPKTVMCDHLYIRTGFVVVCAEEKASASDDAVSDAISTVFSMNLES